jgi:formamidopyrimidine-DNA glycosylase
VGHYAALVPELPEVETVRRQIQPLVSGMEILDAWAHPSAKFASAPDAVGHRISSVSRRGKYLLFGLEPLAASG